MICALSLFLGCVKKTIINDYNTKNQLPLRESKHIAFLNKQVVVDEIISHNSALFSCYKSRFVKNKTTGRITVDFIISKDGTVRGVFAKDNTLDSNKSTECILNIFMQMQFPPGMTTDIRNDALELSDSGGGVKISFPLLFSME